MESIIISNFAHTNKIKILLFIYFILFFALSLSLYSLFVCCLLDEMC